MTIQFLVVDGDKLAMTDTKVMRIAVSGAAGRMGQMLVQAISNDPQVQLGGALEHSASPALGRDAGLALGIATGVNITDQVEEALRGCDVIIDFTRPEATLTTLAACRRNKVSMVIGTTGFQASEKRLIEEASKEISIVQSANMSVGVNATAKILEIAAKILNQGFDVEVIEAHHRHKVDAPSGTALMLGEVVANATGRSLDTHGVFARQGVTGPREMDSIGFSVIRGGDIVGDHTVLFAGDGERIEITHKSSSRMTYAIGSVRACKFLMTQRSIGRAGLFNMVDVLGL